MQVTSGAEGGDLWQDWETTAGVPLWADVGAFELGKT